MYTISETGPEIRGNKVRFRIFLPGINGPLFKVRVFFINKQLQFDTSIPANVHDLHHLSPSPSANNLWGDLARTLWQSEFITLPPGTYLYRFEISGPSVDDGSPVRSLYFADPCARETDTGIFSVFRLPAPSSFAWTDVNFKVPNTEDLILYELNVAEFGGTFNGVAERIPYLISLGVNAIELMPVNSIAEPTRWGYMPVFYMAPEERYGGSAGLKEMVRACHSAGIAVVLDMVYAHTDRMFPYQLAYERFFQLWKDDHYSDSSGIHRSPNPMVSAYDDFGKKNDWRMKSVQEFFAAVNKFWMTEYHIDGFRYDHVNGYLDHQPVEVNGKVDWNSRENRPTFESLRNLSLITYETSKNHSRFVPAPNVPSRIIQISEDLGESAYQLSPVSGSAINGNWEKSLAVLVQDMAENDSLSSGLARELLLADYRFDESGFTGIKKVGNDNILALPVQYIESHDESRLFYLMQHGSPASGDEYDYRNGLDGQPWWRLQPYAIALLTCVGIPMLYAGQEFAENTGLAETGMSRVRGLRPLHWDYFYNADDILHGDTVLPLVTLYRNLGKLRKNIASLRSGRGNAKEEYCNTLSKVLAYRRWKGNEVVIIVLNFSGDDQEVPLTLGYKGTWTDVLEAAYLNPAYTIDCPDPSVVQLIGVPGSFGRILRITV